MAAKRLYIQCVSLSSGTEMISQGGRKPGSWWTTPGVTYLELCTRLLALEGEWSASLFLFPIWGSVCDEDGSRTWTTL